jgi:hypothetical protein
MVMPSNRRRWVKAARIAAYCATAIAVILTAAAFILPQFLDSPAVRAEIQRKLSDVVQGEVAWDDLSIRILPWPRGVLRKARVDIPGIASVHAEQIDARLLFWPLLRGRAEITTVNVVRPEIRIDIATPTPADEKKVEEGAGSLDPLAIYRSVMEPVVGVVRQFAPDTVISVEDALVDVRAPGMPPIELRDLSVRARSGFKGLDLELTTASNYWSRLKLSARIEFSDLSGKASLDASDIRPQAWLDRYMEKSPVRVAVPAANLRAQASVDAKTSLECDFDVTAGAVDIMHARERVRVADAGLKGKVKADSKELVVGLDDVRLGASRLHGVKLRYETKSSALAGGAEFDLDLKQGLDYTRRLAPEEAGAVLAWFQSVTGRAQGSVKLDLGQRNWSVGVDIRKSDVSVQVRDLPGPVRLAGGAVEIDGQAVRIDRAALSMPAGQVLLSKLRYSLKDGTTAGSAGFDLDLAMSLELVRRLLPEENRAALADIQSVTGRAQGIAKFAVSGDHWSAGVNVLKSDSSMQVRQLPGPVRITGGSVQIDPKTVSVDRVAFSMLDAQALVSATVSDYRTDRLQATATMPEGAMGEKVLAWIWQLAKAPPHLELKAPIRVTARRVTWGPDQALDVQATARFDSGPAIAVELGWMPGALDIRRAAIKDERSDAVFALRTEGRLLEGKFSGSLDSTSIAAMLKTATVPAGAAAGDLRIVFDHENPRRTTAEGHLKGEALDLAWLLRWPVKIDRIDLATDETTLRIREAAVDWAGQRATISGVIRRSASGPVIDAQLDSSGVIVDALLPREDKTAGEKPPEAEGRSKQAPDDKSETAQLWPLPVTGRIAVRSDFVQSGRLKVAPVVATLVLEERRARLDLTQAQLCGISLPLTIEAAPNGISASAQITAQKQSLQQAAHCLTDQRVLITGDFDLQADLRTEGKAGELVRNLKGTVRADMRDGRVMKFALLGNILSMQNVAALLEKEGPRLDDTGFPYRSVTVAGHFQAGRFIVEESAFRSDAIGLAANGWISILDYQSRLSVLVAPFGRLDQLVRKVPILGYVVGGTFTSVPVGVSGDIRDPLVVPLGPGAITSELMGIFERTLTLPGKLITLPERGREPGSPPDGQ